MAGRIGKSMVRGKNPTFLENSKISKNRSLVKIWALKILVVNTKREIRKATEKTCLILDNTYVIISIILVDI